MTAFAITASQISKTYRLYPNLSSRLGAILGLSKGGNRCPSFDALKDVSFTIGKGERVGLVGRNGAGKTTLLKLILGHIQPSGGSLEINGSVQAMIHTAMGMHFQFTGRENIRSALSYQNLSPDMIAEFEREIEDFTEMKEYMDQPMQNYSLGMQSRLQFAIASALKPEILIIDEMLGAGDQYFMRKCNRRLERLIDTGCTLLLVSHNTQQVLQFCERALWLRSGQLFYDGSVHDVVNSYEAYLEQETDKRISGQDRTEKTDQRQRQGQHRKEEFQRTLPDGKKVFQWPGKDGLDIEAIEITDGKGQIKNQFASNDSCQIHFTLRASVAGDYTCRYILSVWTKDGHRVARIENDTDSFTLQKGEQREMIADLSPLLLNEGEYTLSFAIYDLANQAGTYIGNQQTRYDYISRSLDFSVTGQQDNKGGIFQIPILSDTDNINNARIKKVIHV